VTDPSTVHGYAIAQAIQAILQGTTRFPDANVTIGDYRILNMGVNEAAIITPGAVPGNEEDGQNRQLVTWHTLVDLFERDQQDGTAWVDFYQERDDVIGTLQRYPNLNQTAVEIVAYGISADGDPAQIKSKDNAGPLWIVQTLRIEITERVVVSGGDFGS